jgi:oxygen-dependent protoporphyrinogen oxidase
VTTRTRRVLVVGGGITGLAAAVELAGLPDVEVVLREAAPRLGGKILTTPFAGLPGVDEGPDAFLARLPDATGFARRLGLGDLLTSPTDASAAVWHDRLHPIPEGLVLGVPASVGPFARTGLLSWRGKARAALEPILPRTSTQADSIGAFVRARFGDEVHERLVDALVGSIYGADTDRFSLAAVPQLAALAGQHRSILVAARAARGRAAQATGPVFATPTAGLGALVDAAADAVTAAGGTITLGQPVTDLARDGEGWRVDNDRFDAVVVTAPARPAADLLRGAATEAARLLDAIDVVDVILVTLAVPASAWPERLHGRSGYLVPKPDQRLVTAASFGSQKWAHWRPADGTQVVRVSLGRDGLPVDHLDDAAATAAAVSELGRHLALDVQPTEVRVSRWPGAFPQYRPHHAERVRAVAAALPIGVVAAGASHDGIGIPSCIRQGIAAAHRVADQLGIARAASPEGARS